MALSNAIFSFPTFSYVPNSKQLQLGRSSPKSVTNHRFSHGFSLEATVSHDHLVLYEKKLKDVRQMLVEAIDESRLKGFAMVNTLQQLAIDYHFQKEIQSVLSSHYTDLTTCASCWNGDSSSHLYEVSLSFRVLRQNGYHMTTDVFNRFVGRDGKFDDQVSKDLKGMVSLYQASQFGLEGEALLDEANAFAGGFLHNSLPHLNKHQASIVKYILANPLNKTITRFNVKKYMKAYNTELEKDAILLKELAEMDFNIVQSLHQKELLQVSSWWRDLGLAKEMNFARNQPVKWYMLSMSMLPDLLNSQERIDLTKPISLVYLMDDIFDVYGTLEELILFTEAINKWEIVDTEHLSYPLRIFLKVLDDITNEISSWVLKEHGWNPVNSLRKAWIGLCNAFLVEAKWFNSGNLPTSEEYLKNGVISSGVHLVFVHLFFLLGHNINRECVHLVDNIPALITHPATILRLWDDLGSAEDENQQGHDGSYIASYMKAHKSSTTESAREHVMKMISTSWKKLNKEYLSPNHFSPTLKNACLNTAKMVEFAFSYDTDGGLPTLEKRIESLLYESITVTKKKDC